MKDGLSLKCAETEDLPDYMVASWRSYASEDLVLSAAYDASRLGSPLEDTQLYGLQESPRGSWGDPMLPT